MSASLNADERRTVQDYDRNAEFYQATEPHLSDLRWSLGILAISKLLVENPQFLDVGCGHGRMVPALRNAGISRYIGIDPSRRSIELAKKTYPDTDFRVVGVYDLNETFSQGYFDAFFAVTTLAHIPRHKMAKALAAIRQVMKREAIGCITMPQFNGTARFSKGVPASVDQVGPYTTMTGWQYRELSPLLKTAGFEWYEPIYENGQLILGVVAV